jgi:hypothetical protein
MKPPVEFQDRSAYHHWMALELMGRTIAWVLTVEQFKDKVRGG